MKVVFLSLLAVLCLGTVAGEPRKAAELKIDVYEWGEDSVLVSCRGWSASVARYDTLVARNGKLTYTAVLGEPTAVVVTPLRAMEPKVRVRGWYTPASLSVTTLLLPGTRQRIKGWVDDHGWLNYQASGTDRYCSDEAKVRSLTLPYRARIDTIERRLIVAPQGKMKGWYELRKEVLDQIDSVQLTFLDRFPSTPVAGALLRSARYSDRFFDYEKRIKPKVRNGLFKEQIDRLVEQEEAYQAVQKAKEEVVVGAIAPPIELPDSSGVVRRLDELKGKWVVIDFWGTWCGWCLHGIPEMKKAYEKHQNVVEFLGVACNDKEQPWRAALVDFALPWVNVFESSKGALSAPARYGVDAYPTKIVVDPQGEIVLKTTGEDPAFYTALDQLINTQQ